jgi:isopenicillin N synthase-like dioxygenase
MNNAYLPVINVESLIATPSPDTELAAKLRDTSREYGFFYVVGHGVDEDLQLRLEQASRDFFAQNLDRKREIDMSRGGRAWRGYFPPGGELTSGKPDLKEGVYFGAELTPEHPLVKADTPLHGPNLFPSDMPEFRRLVLEYMAAMTRLGHALMRGISLSLGLEESYFADHYTSDPLILFRIFNYPPASESGFGVGEHTDYGLLTIVRQDMSGGLQVKNRMEWLDVTPIPNAFVCNVGDMLDRITAGEYLSAPHRVQSSREANRLSFAFFFDPNFNAQVFPIRPNGDVRDNKNERWDRASVHEFRGTYGDYLLSKVSKVFPELARQL